MKVLVMRYVSLLILIATFIIHTFLTKQSITAAFFVCAAILTLYFITPLMKKARGISDVLVALILFSGVFASLDVLYILPLIAFFMIEGSFSLPSKSYSIFIGFIIALSICFTIGQWMPLYSLFFMILLAVCSLLLHYYIKASNEKNILYEELLGQYRALKRSSVEQEQLVRAEERTKIARDMHDSVGHNLTALLMQVEMMSIQNSTDLLDEVKELAKKSLDETRYAVRQLKSTETYGIESVLQLIRKLEIESRLHIRFTIEKGVLSLAISNNQSIVLYRILQECLTNAMKYSESKEVDIILGRDSLQQLCFTVKNKVSTPTPIVHGFGLKNMAERIQEIGGHLQVYKTAQQFIVEGSFPLKESK
ncbi:histidine kinase [Lysinibacillus sp. KU-BSD001]|uniref:sensor histidine kinase n=1 Tax=Lysinibacillus sp. KU-BSD001 TaxID=3141328 RepID=UPI0036ECBE6A